jgi:hypothetical protein
VWIIIGGWTIGQLVIYNNPTFKELFKVEEDQIFR